MFTPTHRTHVQASPGSRKLVLLLLAVALFSLPVIAATESPSSASSNCSAGGYVNNSSSHWIEVYYDVDHGDYRRTWMPPHSTSASVHCDIDNMRAYSSDYYRWGYLDHDAGDWEWQRIPGGANYTCIDRPGSTYEIVCYT